MKATRSGNYYLTLFALALSVWIPHCASAKVIRVPSDEETLQLAANAADSGDEIVLEPGVYQQQLAIEDKRLTLRGEPGAVIRAWAGMEKSSRYIWFNLVEVTRGSIVIRDLEFEGEHLHETLNPQGGLYSAVSLDACDATVEHCRFRGFRGKREISFVTSVGIVTWNPVSLGAGVVTVNIRSNTFSDNAAAMWITGDWITEPAKFRTAFNIEDNEIFGIGPTRLGAQHGVVIACGSRGSIQRNRITGFYRFNPGIAGSAIGILGYDLNGLNTSGHVITSLQPLHIENNILTNNQQGIAMSLADNTSIVRNSFGGVGELGGDGMLVSGAKMDIQKNRFASLNRGIVLVGNDPGFGTIFGIASEVRVNANRFCDVSDTIQTEDLSFDNIIENNLECPFDPPALGVKSAVSLSWMDDGETHSVEKALSLQGPWSVVSLSPTSQDGVLSVSVPIDGTQAYFRLH